MNLKTAFEPYFKVGAAISGHNLRTPAHLKLLSEQFSSFTAENDMKPMFFLDRDTNKSDPEKYDRAPALNFDRAIPYLEYAKASGMKMRGHTLVWHNQTPKWFFRQGYNENLPYADRETMLARLESYIHGVLDFVQTNYPGIIYAWDVVNEAIDEGDFRKSLWSTLVGTDFVEQAFTFARKYAAPDVALFYNDYETAQVWKRDLIIEKILKPLIDKKLVDGMGMQSHLMMDHPDLNDYRTALEMYGALGLQVQITELDMHCNDGSDASMQALAERYADFFRIYVDAKKSGKANITSVTFWNLRDEDSWLPGFRKEPSFPLLFHKQCEAKQAYYEVLKVAVDPESIDKWEPHYSEEDFVTAPRPEGEMKVFRQNIWEDGEYDYPAAYGFVPNVFAYLHNDNEKHDCMVIVPGGGYCMTVPHEGELAGNVFYRHGMNVFVLSYTTDITMSVPLKQQPLKDISRTIRGLRKHGAEYGIDGKKIFICGFSAGGHVCGSLAVHFDEMPEENPLYKGISDRPDGVILSYPVLTSGKYTHADSMRALLGNDPDPAELDYFCLEKHVKDNTPPCFLWQTRGDDLVPVQNTYLFAEALLEKNIPFAHHVFPAGGHGLSVASREQFAGWSGGEYTMEQTMRAAFAVKEGKGVNVSEQRRAEITDQFFGGHEEPVYGVDYSLLEDLSKWTDLAWAWIRRITGDL